jgi:hypothetical protein
MFEARTVGAGATQASAGILAPFIEGHDRGLLFDLGLRSLRMYDAFVRDVCDESGLTVEYRRCGTLEWRQTPRPPRACVPRPAKRCTGSIPRPRTARRPRSPARSKGRSCARARLRRGSDA